MPELDALLAEWGRAQRLSDSAPVALLPTITSSDGNHLPAGGGRAHTAATGRLATESTRVMSWQRFVAA
ncbi:MAG: hypothetical protein ACR2F6_17705 [Mycobacteriales bacterium]